MAPSHEDRGMQNISTGTQRVSRGRGFSLGFRVYGFRVWVFVQGLFRASGIKVRERSLGFSRFGA